LSDLQHKSVTIKELSGEGGLEAVISTFGVKDRDGDIMLAAAFARSSGKAIPMVWHHDWDKPVGKGVVHVTPTEAVFTGQFFMDTERGQEAYKTVKAMGDLQEYSIGFRILEATDEKVGGEWVRTIKDIELFEASPVLVGAAYGTHTVAVKDNKALWDAAYINDLPDSAFAVILPGGEKDGEWKTTPRNLRKLPHHSSEGSIDLPHLRNALSREPQTDMAEDAHAKAAAHLQRHADAEGIGEGKELVLIHVTLDHFADDIKAGRVMSARNQEQMHSLLKDAMALHVSTCDMGDDCPMNEQKRVLPDLPDLDTPERKAQRAEIDKLLACVKLEE